MKQGWLKTIGLFAGLLASALMGIDYPVTLHGASATFSNEAGYAFTTNTTNESLIVTEMPLSHFLIVTNGSPIYAGSNFSLALRAVDAWGYHVTVTHSMALSLASFSSNRVASPTNLHVTQVPFLSPSASLPDFSGLTVTNSYPLPGFIFISVDQTDATNFLDPGLLTILPNPVSGILTFDRPRYLGYGAMALLSLVDGDRNRDAQAVESVTVRVSSTSDTNGKWVTLTETGVSTGIFTNTLGFESILTSQTNRVYATSSNDILADYADPEPPLSFTTNSRFDLIRQIWTRNPVFMGSGRATYLQVIGVSSDGFSNDITPDYRFLVSTEAGTSPSLSLVASNEIGSLAPGLGRTLLSNVYDPSLSTNVVFLVSVQTDQAAGLSAARMSLGIPAGSPSAETWFDVRHTSNWQLVYPVADPTSALQTALAAVPAGSFILPQSTHALTTLDSNLAPAPSLRLPLSATLYYTTADLTNVGTGGLGRISADSLKVVTLGANGLWTEVSGVEHDRGAQGLRFSPTVAGVYGLMATLSRQPTDNRSVAAYPSPFDLRKDPQMFLVNLPEDVKAVRIYAADSTLVRTLRDVGYREMHGKVFRSVIWDGKGEGGQSLKMGLYFAEIPSSTGTIVKKLVLIR